MKRKIRIISRYTKPGPHGPKITIRYRVSYPDDRTRASHSPGKIWVAKTVEDLKHAPLKSDIRDMLKEKYGHPTIDFSGFQLHPKWVSDILQQDGAGAPGDER